MPAAKLHRARELARVCAEFDTELPVAALQYSLRDHNVQTVLVGAADAEQVRENVRRMSAPIPDGLWDRLIDDGLIAR